MTKVELIMDSLRAEQERKAKMAEFEQERMETPEPQDANQEIRRRLALALMRADHQLSCTNCTWRYRPCRQYKECKVNADMRFFSPKKSLMEMQLNRVDHILNEIRKL